MNLSKNVIVVDYATQTDADLVRFTLQGNCGAFSEIMQRCSQPLFRVARGIVDDDDEAEDVVQESYTRAFDKLSTFRGEASLLTWLTRIVINESRERLRRQRPLVDLAAFGTTMFEDGRVVALRPSFGEEDPAAGAARAQIRGLIEQAISELPLAFRIVFVMRDIEQFTVEETASLLQIRSETVKTRLHRARRMLRTALEGTRVETMTEAFPFQGARCERMRVNVLKTVAANRAGGDSPTPST